MTITLCIDVGGTGLKAALVDDDAQILGEQRSEEHTSEL